MDIHPDRHSGMVRRKGSMAYRRQRAGIRTGLVSFFQRNHKEIFQAGGIIAAGGLSLWRNGLGLIPGYL